MTKQSSTSTLRSHFLRPSFTAVVVAAVTAFGLASCSSDEDPKGDDAAGTSGSSSGSSGAGGKGSSGTTSGGAGAGGAAGTSAAGTSSSGTGGTTGGTGTAGTGTAGKGGSSTGGAGAGGTSTAGAGGSTGGTTGGTGGSALGGAGAGGTGGSSGGSAGSGGAPTDWDVMASDFDCIRDWDKVLGMRIKNVLGQQAAALEVAENAEGGVYPVGTIIQHLPTEAMVKRPAGFSTETKDWEFFLLTINAQGTTIAERGTTMIETSMGATCVSCHDMSPDQFDFVCNTYGEHGSGNCGFDFSEQQLNQQIDSDPRCD